MISRLRKILLPPESPQELFLRTLYHRLNATPWFINRQMKKAQTSYLEWRTTQNILPYAGVGINGLQPKITFLLTVSSGNEAATLETLRSIQKTGTANWQVFPVISDAYNWKETNLSISDPRVRLPVRIENLTSAINELTGTDFVLFCSAGDLFDESLTEIFRTSLSNNPAADIYYYDCEYQQGNGAPAIPFFKPAALSPELMLSVNYLSRGFIRLSSLAGMIEDKPPAHDLLVLEFALLLSLIDKKAITRHIPRTMLSQAPEDEPFKKNQDAVIQEHFSTKGLLNVKVEREYTGRRVNWQTDEPSVSVIILNRDHGSWLRALVNSIFTLTDYPDYSLIIVDNASSESDVKHFYAELENNKRVKIVHYDSDFNYSEAINIGVAHSQADIIVLLNNDMQVTDARWLRELVQWTKHPEIGVVGGKLLHRNRSIQHAGIILGMNGFIGHLYLNAPEHYYGLAGSVNWYRNFYALTGACQAMRRELFHRVGGYDERFKLAFGDIDFCLRVIKAGYRNLYNPHAELIHFEGGSRGYETPVKDILLGYEELGPWLKQDDPYFSPNLTYNPIPRCNFAPDAINTRLANIENRKRSIETGRKPADSG